MFTPIRSALLQVTAILLVALIAPAYVAAEGVNLAWSHCYGEGTGVQNMAFACDTNAGSNTMVGSFVLGVNKNDIIGYEAVLDLASASAVLPAWWSSYYSGTCRMGSFTANMTQDPTDVVCVDWAQGLAFGGLAALCTIAGECADHPTYANVARAKIAAAAAQENKQDLAAGTEYFAFNLRMNNAKTVGAGSCGGCEVPVCIVFNSINIVPEGTIGSRKLTTAAHPGSNYVTWQGGGVPAVGPVVGCPAATASRRSAWSTVKALYR